MDYEKHINDFIFKLDTKTPENISHAYKIARTHLQNFRTNSEQYKMLKSFADKLEKELRKFRKHLKEEENDVENDGNDEGGVEN